MQLDLVLHVVMLVCFAWMVAQLLDQRPSFLAAVRHISVLNKSLPRFRCSPVSAVQVRLLP